MIGIKRAQNNKEYEGILSLQKQNHVENISISEKELNGFVTVKHNLEVLKKMSVKAPQYIAIKDGELVGYVLTLVRSLKSDFEILKPMFDEFKKIEFKSILLENYNYVVSGQACIDANNRGLGILSQIYKQMENDLGTVYDLCVTEIAISNTRSIKAHEKIGFNIIHSYFDGKQDWYIVVWDWTKSHAKI